jgi:membrane protease YdiL (CAAX protease family)
LQNNAALIAQSIVVIICLLAILVIHGSLKPHGITSEKAGRDAIQGIAIGTGLFLLDLLIARWMGIEDLGTIPHESRSAGIEGWIAIAGSGLIGLLLNSVAEELVMRGYLTIRLEQLTGSAYLAVLIPTILFAGYHVYHGVYGAVMVGLTGFVLGVWFFKTRRLLGPIIAHTCFNLCFMFQELLSTWAGS